MGDQIERVHEILETIGGRLTLLEERQDFTDALLQAPDRRRFLLGTDEGGTPKGLEASGGDPAE